MYKKDCKLCVLPSGNLSGVHVLWLYDKVCRKIPTLQFRVFSLRLKYGKVTLCISFVYKLPMVINTYHSEPEVNLQSTSFEISKPIDVSLYSAPRHVLGKMLVFMFCQFLMKLSRLGLYN